MSIDVSTDMFGPSSVAMARQEPVRSAGKGFADLLGADLEVGRKIGEPSPSGRDSSREDGRAQVESELYPLLAVATGKLSYLSCKQSPTAASDGHAMGDVSRLSGCDYRYVGEDIAVLQLSYSQSTEASKRAPVEALSSESRCDPDNTEVAVVRSVSSGVLSEHLSALLRRRVSVHRSQDRIDVLIRDYSLSEQERMAVVESLVTTVDRAGARSIRVTINGEDWSSLVRKCATQTESQNAS